MATDLPSQHPENPTSLGIQNIGVPISAGSPEQQGGGHQPSQFSRVLSYLESVKLQLEEQPEVYDKFLDILRKGWDQVIDTPEVIERVSVLFHGHPALMEGFNSFLPTGYGVEAGNNINPNAAAFAFPAGSTTQGHDVTLMQEAATETAPEIANFN